MIARIRSFAVTPVGKVPSTLTSMDFIFLIDKHCVAITCSTSEVPTPNASAANAPCVLVWESPATTVIPGRVAPCSGPMTWMMPWRRSCKPNSVIPNSLQFFVNWLTWMRESGSAMPCARDVVGTLWSAVASTVSRRHGLRPDIRNPSKACGLVTS